jgi:hypothetical protein
MPQIQPITATAIQWTPVKRIGNAVVYNDLTQPIASLRKTLTLSFAEPSKTSKLFKIRIRIVSPVEAMDKSVTPNVGLGVVDYLNSVDMTYIYDARSTDVSRLEIVDGIFNLLNFSPEVSALAEDLTPLY